MKRAFAFLLLAFVLVAPISALSGQWVTQEIGWQTSNQGGPLGATAIWVRDTLKARFAGVITSNGGPLDTSGTFKGLGLGIVGQRVPAVVATSHDSLLLGWLILVGDSTIASTFSTATLAIDANMGGYGGNTTLGQWVQVDSISTTGVTANNPVAIFPVRPYGTFGGAQHLLAYNNLRARGTAGVGIMYSARLFWKYWDPSK